MNAAFEEAFSDEEWDAFHASLGAFETPAETSDEQYEDLTLAEVMAWEAWEEGELDNFPLLPC